MTTISSGVNSYLTTYNTTQPPVVSGSSGAPTNSASPVQSSVSISLSASSKSMASAYALASAPLNPANLTVAGNTLNIAESVPGSLNPNDIVRIYDGTKDVTSKFSGYSAATTPAGIAVTTAGTLSTTPNSLAYNGKISSSLSFTVSKYLGPGSYDPESVKSNVVVSTLDTAPPLTPRATQGTGASSRIITLISPERNTTVEIWNGDPASGGVQVYGSGAADTFMPIGINQFSAKSGAYNGTESQSLRVYLRDAAGNLSLPSAVMTRPIDSLNRSANANTAAYVAARDAGTLASFTPIDIVDRSSAIVDNIDLLQEMAAGGYAPSIKLNDSRPSVLTLTATQVANDADALNMLTSSVTPPVAFSISCSNLAETRPGDKRKPPGPEGLAREPVPA